MFTKRYVKWISLVSLGLFVVAATIGLAANESTTAFVYPPFKHTWGVVRGTPAKLFMLVGNRAKFSEPRGLACVRMNSWDDPKLTADDDEVTVYGVNSGQNTIIYNKSMYELGIYGDRQSGEAKLKDPWGIAANSNGDVFVSDMGNHRVVRLFNPKSELNFVSSFGGLGTENGKFNQPRGIALDNEGRVYVADYLNNRIQIHESDGTFIRSIFGLLGPVAVSVTDAKERWSYNHSTNREAFLVVVDSLEGRVSKYSLDGVLLKRVTARSWGVSNARIQFAAIDFFSQVLLTDGSNNCIWKLDRNLNLLSKFGKRGSGDYEFDDPRGITLYRRFGQIFIAEREGAQYLWVGVDLLRPDLKWEARNRVLTVTGFLTETAKVDIDLLDASGKLVTRIQSARINAGAFTETWDGAIRTFPKTGLTDAEESQVSRFQVGNPVSPGSYQIRISARATYSSVREFEREVTLPVSL
ncbi:MAG: hypothetical protein OEM52_12440 [bacterium]|nr:hypothetical protein [bacterium]